MHPISTEHVLAHLANIHGISNQEFVHSMYRLLGGSAEAQSRSRLTRTGENLEFSVACSQKPIRALRYTIDGTTGIMQPVERVHKSDAITQAALAALGSSTGVYAHKAIQAAIMEPWITHPSFGDFTIWHGVVHTPDNHCIIKVYYNLRPWRAIPDRLFEALLNCPGLGSIEKLWNLDYTPPNWPCFLGVEFDINGIRATKLYWQRLAPLYPSDVNDRASRVCPGAVSNLFDLARQVFLSNKHAYAAPSVILSSKVSVQSSDIEAGVHYGIPWFVPDDETARAYILSLLDSAGLDTTNYESTWTALQARSQATPTMHSVLGIVASSRLTRMTVYFNYNNHE